MPSVWILPMNIAAHIASELQVKPAQINAAIELLDAGATVPFVARYRKEATGALDDSQLRTLAQRLEYLRDLEARKTTVIDSIREQGKLTDTLEKAIRNAETKVRLEDLYLPYKPKRRNKAHEAREAGLQPLADALLQAPSHESPTSLAQKALPNTQGIDSVADALEGASHILLEQWSEQADLLAQLRNWLWKEALVTSRVMRGKAQDDSKFRDYYSHSEALGQMPSHRALAVFRGQKEGELKIALELSAPQTDHALEMIRRSQQITTDRSACGQWLLSTLQLAWQKKLLPQLETDLLKRLREQAETEAIAVFARNLKDLLLAAPAGQKSTIGLDPGLRTGVKVAVVDATGKLLEHCTLYPHAPHKRWDEAIQQLAKLAKKHHSTLVSIGNGTASRETDQLVKELCKKHPELALSSVMVSEAGASVYSASELASQEFPDLDVTIRGAVSIARRLQDPLAELVKIEPKAIGVGQYQHDVDQKALSGSLQSVVEDCVNHVGVDLNTASCELLSQVAGLNRTTAQNIIHYRDEHGRFANRNQLLKVPRLGAKAFEQCAAFLRIRDGQHPLDNSAVHPEAYGLVDQIAAHLNSPVSALIGNPQVLEKLDIRAFINAHFGEYTLRDILKELEKPGRDPRPSFKTARFAEGVETLKDLLPGMQLEGVVTNVTNFGAFVDIGVHQDGLVHISQLADHFIKDPHSVVKAGDIVTVTVAEVDIGRKRIALSMRSQNNNSAPTKSKKAQPPTTPMALGERLKASGFKVK